MGWRFQVPYLASLGLQVIVPDMLGYGQTSAPDSPSEYTMKKMTSHIAALIKSNTNKPIILGGHDWGGAFAWRMAMYYPDLIQAVFSFCVPYTPPSPSFITLQDFVQHMPNSRYQSLIADGAIESALGDPPTKLSAFVNGMFYGSTPEGQFIFSPKRSIHPDRLASVGASPYLDQEMVDYYVREYSRNGLRGPCNWYRTQRLNFEDELVFTDGGQEFKFNIPAMIVMAEFDDYLPPSLADGQEKYFTAGLKKEVIASSHCILVEKYRECNQLVKDFVSDVLGENLEVVNLVPVG